MDNRLTSAASWTLALCGVLLLSCDDPPDIHVHIQSAIAGPHEYVAWRLWHHRRLRPAFRARAQYSANRAPGGFSLLLPEQETPTVFRIFPLAAPTQNQLFSLRVDRYLVPYTPNRPAQSIVVLLEYSAKKHLRFDVRFERHPCDRGELVCNPYRGVSTRVEDPCSNVFIPRDCRRITPEESQQANGNTVPARGDFDEGDGDDLGDSGPLEPPLPSQVCELKCENLAEEHEAAPELQRATPAGTQSSTPMDAGVLDVPTPQRDAPNRDVPNRDVPNADESLDASDGELPDVELDETPVPR